MKPAAKIVFFLLFLALCLQPRENPRSPCIAELRGTWGLRVVKRGMRDRRTACGNRIFCSRYDRILVGVYLWTHNGFSINGCTVEIAAVL